MTLPWSETTIRTPQTPSLLYPKPTPSNRMEHARVYTSPDPGIEGSVRLDPILKNVYLACRHNWTPIAESTRTFGNFYRSSTPPTAPVVDGTIWKNEDLKVSVSDTWYSFAAKPFLRTQGQVLQALNPASESWVPLNYELQVTGLSSRISQLDASGNLLNVSAILGLVNYLANFTSSGTYLGTHPIPNLEVTSGVYQGSVNFNNQVRGFSILTPIVRDSQTPVSLFAWHAPFPATLTTCPKASLVTAGTTDTLIDIRVNGATILATPIRIVANGSYSSEGALLSTWTLANDARITVHVTQIGSGSKGLKVSWTFL